MGCHGRDTILQDALHDKIDDLVKQEMEDFSNAMELKQLLPETALPVPDSVLSRYHHFLPLPFFFNK